MADRVLHPVRVVTQRTGLSPDLLRAWERRYRIVEPRRSAGGQRLYSDAGTRACWNALTPGGVLGVWSAGPNEKYAERLERFGFEPEVRRVLARTGGRAAHVLFLGTKIEK